MTDKLSELRDALDGLDNEMIALLVRRFEISAQVAAAKNGDVTFRPGREAAILRRLQVSAPSLDPAMLLGIWRYIFTASVAQQKGNLRVAAHVGAGATAQWHLANSVDVDIYEDANALLASMLAGEFDYVFVPVAAGAQIGAFMMANDGLNIVAKTPFFEVPGLNPCYIIGAHQADASELDANIYAVAGDNGVKLVEDAGTPPVDLGGDNAKFIGKVAI